jgi:hypothetical protein
MVLYTIFAAVWLISNKQSPAGAVARAVDASAVDATSCGPQLLQPAGAAAGQPFNKSKVGVLPLGGNRLNVE